MYLSGSFYSSEENLHILFILKNILFFFNSLNQIISHFHRLHFTFLTVNKLQLISMKFTDDTDLYFA